MTNPVLIDEIARDAGATVGPRLYSDALSKSGGPAPTYEAMMRYNVGALVAGMSKN
jgi:zinc/manganese transport system substrate-binding protein